MDYYNLLLLGDILLSRHTIIDDDGVTVLFIIMHTLLFPPPITHPSTTLPTIGAFDGAPVGKTLEAGDENILGEVLGKSLG